ncbi:3-deoxy-7-phosphoheptulonate synthase [Treponema parvum]|uniref:Prephenate dehydratase n=1 Tax=Treponema parvum TaxID=138851 RepID=A0A975IC29_9SPIR|nr:3-deoxy-7-phosphoheptulonate synthase [Treponema parvum]QTQ11581.1 3-deoxy-7-phosphoheptulonate synthase [Treponema parvum]
MVIVLKKSITPAEKEKLASFLGSQNFKTNEIVGEETTILAAVGKLKMDPREVEILPGVERVIPISKPYKMASREFDPHDTIVEIPNNRGQIVRVGGQRIVAIAGPCAVESRAQMMSVAAKVAESGAVMLRGGAYKPRTSPYSFQGLGEEGIKILKEAGDAFGLPVVTEVVASEYLPVMESYGVDVYQVGARNMQNFELLKRLGKLNKPVILKRGLSATIEEWLMSAEYLLSAGTDRVILCERGIRTYEQATRNTLDLSAIPILRGLTHLPIIVDPSHAVGIRDKVSPMGLAAVASGADGIIVEVHCDPDKALSDGAQSLYPEQFDKLMRDIEAMSPVLGKQVAHIRQERHAIKVSGRADKRNGKTLTCSFCGKRGAYAEQAIESYFGKEAEAVSVNSFREIFKSVVSGESDYGMVPIENSLAGSVYDNYDNLVQFADISIVGSVTLRIQHSLLGIKGSSIDKIKTVYSHPQAFSQCSDFLSSHGDWTKIDSVSTASAAEYVAKLGSKDTAAVASPLNAKYYGLEILQENIENDPRNYTRFVLIASDAATSNTAAPNKPATAKNITEAAFISQRVAGVRPNMASFVFSVKNEPGALYTCLGIFNKHNLNLTRLESRPILGKPWRYWFYADAELKNEGEQSEEYVSRVLDELKNTAEDVRLLGVYAGV